MGHETKESYVFVPLSDAHAVLHMLLTKFHRPGGKIIVFSPTPEASDLSHMLFQRLDNLPNVFSVTIKDMFAAAAQKSGTSVKVIRDFIDSPNGVLFTDGGLGAEVSGVDGIVHFGLPASRALCQSHSA